MRDQRARVRGDGRPAGAAIGLAPAPAREVAVPSHQHRRRHHEPNPPIGGQEPRQSSEQRPIRPHKPWPRRRAAEHGELVAEDHDLRVTIEVATAPSEQPEDRHEGQLEGA